MPSENSVVAASAFSDVGSVSPADLTDTRVAVHWAAQIPAAAATRLIAARSDYTHSSLEWIPGLRAFATEAVNPRGHRVVLLPEAFEVGVLEGSDVRHAVRLDGRTFAEIFDRLGSALGTDGIALPGFTLPHHPVADGAAFARPEHLSALASWFDASQRLLEAIHAAEPEASTVRCWPHHFDVATLLTLDPDEPDAEKARAIGVGFSPGDDTFPEPYLYVTPWPYPAPSELVELEAGHWHTRGFTAGILKASEIVGAEPGIRPARVATFVSAALAACRRLLGR